MEKKIEIIKNIDPSVIYKELSHPASGGICVFIGAVRDTTQNQKVNSLFFEAYQAMAILREDMDPYVQELRGAYRGQAGMVVAPGSTEEVSAVLAAANEARVAVVPYGGGTGLVAGQVMPEGPAPLILSLERMTRIRRVDPDENVITADAGVVVEELHRAAEGPSRILQIDVIDRWGSKGIKTEKPLARWQL